MGGLIRSCARSSGVNPITSTHSFKSRDTATTTSSGPSTICSCLASQVADDGRDDRRRVIFRHGACVERTFCSDSLMRRCVLHSFSMSHPFCVLRQVSLYWHGKKKKNGKERFTNSPFSFGKRSIFSIFCHVKGAFPRCFGVFLFFLRHMIFIKSFLSPLLSSSPPGVWLVKNCNATVNSGPETDSGALTGVFDARRICVRALVHGGPHSLRYFHCEGGLES